MAVLRNDPQKVALEGYLRPLEEAFPRKGGRRGERAVYHHGREGLRAPGDRRFRSIGASSPSIPFARKRLKSSLERPSEKG